MLRYGVRQLMGLFFMVFLVSVAAFILVRFLPGDAAGAYLNSVNAPLTKEALETVRREMGLDAPVTVQYGKWLMNALHGDLGYSYQTGRLVTVELFEDLKYTGILTAGALGWIFVFSGGMGILSAKYAGKTPDMVIRAFTFAGFSMPKFWLGFLLMAFMSLRLKWFPVQGAATTKHLVLPSFTLACSYIATYTKLLRNSILEVKNRPFVRYAKARGFSAPYVTWRHVIPHSLIPVVSTLGLHLGGILSGSVIVENVFAWPGLGRMCVDAVAARNYPMIQGYILLMSVVFAGANLLCDITCAVLDPQWKRGRKGQYI